MKVNLSRKLVLEERVNTPDGKGGFTVGWQVLGVLWADVDARSGREALVSARDISRVRYRIIVRGAPVGAASQPRPDQRFREGDRVFSILAVAEFDPTGRWLECWAEEGRMSLALSGELQGAIYGALTVDATLVALVGAEIYDAPLPSGGSLPLGEHVTLGEEVVKPFGSVTSSGGVHDFDVVVHSTANGFAAAKVVAAAVSNALVDVNLTVVGGHLVSLRFVKAKAKRGIAPELRRIEMRFRAVVEDI